LGEGISEFPRIIRVDGQPDIVIHNEAEALAFATKLEAAKHLAEKTSSEHIRAVSVGGHQIMHAREARLREVASGAHTDAEAGHSDARGVQIVGGAQVVSGSADVVRTGLGALAGPEGRELNEGIDQARDLIVSSRKIIDNGLHGDKEGLGEGIVEGLKTAHEIDHGELSPLGKDVFRPRKESTASKPLRKAATVMPSRVRSVCWVMARPSALLVESTRCMKAWITGSWDQTCTAWQTS
jgi:hypothetical protein